MNPEEQNNINSAIPTGGTPAGNGGTATAATPVENPASTVPTTNGTMSGAAMPSATDATNPMTATTDSAMSTNGQSPVAPNLGQETAPAVSANDSGVNLTDTTFTPVTAGVDTTTAQTEVASAEPNSTMNQDTSSEAENTASTTKVDSEETKTAVTDTTGVVSTATAPNQKKKLSTQTLVLIIVAALALGDGQVVVLVASCGLYVKKVCTFTSPDGFGINFVSVLAVEAGAVVIFFVHINLSVLFTQK